MVEIGYALSSEEHSPRSLVRFARLAEDAGFTFAMVSDHYHPWLNSQGNSPFAWSVIGGISQVTEKIRIGTGVTCPIIRYHPAIIAQAAATAAAMLPGRFVLGLGSGENLNEHIIGQQWPAFEIRQDMLGEAVEIIRMLLDGKEHSYWGTYYTIENARLYTLPNEPLPIYIAASGRKAAERAGQIGDGLIGVAPNAETVNIFDQNGEKSRPHIGQVTVCWAAAEDSARRTAWQWWRNGVVPGTLSEILPTPAYFEDASENVSEEQVAGSIICGPDKQKHLDAIEQMRQAGYEQVYIHQVGPDQEGFFEFYQREIIPEFHQ